MLRLTLSPSSPPSAAQNLRRYEQLMGGSELVESTLKEVLPELLNAEVRGGIGGRGEVGVK